MGIKIFKKTTIKTIKNQNFLTVKLPRFVLHHRIQNNKLFSNEIFAVLYYVIL